MLTEETPVPSVALPVEEMKDHLRMGSGFADDGLQDVLIETYLRAAMAAIEGRIGKMLFQRRFLLVLDCWRDAEQALPVSPVFRQPDPCRCRWGGSGCSGHGLPADQGPAPAATGGQGNFVADDPERGMVRVVFDAWRRRPRGSPDPGDWRVRPGHDTGALCGGAWTEQVGQCSLSVRKNRLCDKSGTADAGTAKRRGGVACCVVVRRRSALFGRKSSRLCWTVLECRGVPAGLLGLPHWKCRRSTGPAARMARMASMTEASAGVPP
ncbi:MAG: hypothetical protein U1E69_07855 [Tabrizicola sp.]|uniref:head-tail connector protein n=1 Tax=Tabrizicola sp. TaxID=2005166 RepID=UPI002ABA86D9|nr:hypothetical protein [Tabrizicola sp.]MDZ4086704.1 hypothetical protein [Tabrizicola sp.]